MHATCSHEKNGKTYVVYIRMFFYLYYQETYWYVLLCFQTQGTSRYSVSPQLVPMPLRA